MQARLRHVENETHADFCRRIARKGGANGTGNSKRRSPDHYREMQRLGVEARKQRQKNALKELDSKLACVKVVP